MSPRRAAPLALLLALAACAKEVKQGEPQATLVFAAFASDATNPAYLAGAPGPKLPQPSDLALQAVPLLPASAQKELLQALAAAGGFPSDQEVTITIPVRAVQLTDGVYIAAPVPDVDTTTVAANALVLKVDGASAVAVPFDVGGYTKTADGLLGTITLRKQAEAGSRRWAPGRYVVALRGGASGVKTTGGFPLAPDQAIALVSANRDLSQRENQPPGGLSPAQVQSLEGLRATFANPLPWCNMAAGWLPVTSAAAAAACTTAPVPPSQSAFAAVSAHFPLAEVASIQTFSVAPASTVVLIDAGSGVAPLPIDLLRTGPGGTIALNPAFGPAAAGLTTLDGFSTTAMMLAQTSAPIDASTVNGTSVFLYKLDAAGGVPTLVRELKAELGAAQAGAPTANPAAAGYVAEPSQLARTATGGACAHPAGIGCFSTVIGLQPAVRAPVAGVGTFHLPPLDESSSYAVVVTSRVKDMTGSALGKSTVAKILLDVAGALHDTSRPAGSRSLLAGVDDTTSLALQTMRGELAPVKTALLADLANVVSAYTFKTQSITAPALQLAAIPYNPAGPAAVQASASLTPAQVAAQYGILEAYLPSGPTGPLAGFAEVKLNTTSLLLASQNAGAFDPAHAAPEVVTALVAIPNPALVTGACPAGRGFTTTKCAPLVLFHHGITRSKADLLPIAANLAARGFIAVAIDGEKHGDRSYCTSDAQCCSAPLATLGVCTASTCAIKANLRTPVDSVDYGYCETATHERSYLNQKVSCTAPFLADGVTPNQACFSPKGTPYVSANAFVSLNFFRTRDSLRQDVIDQSAVVAALAPPTPSSDAFATSLATLDLAVNPNEIYWVSQSLGSMQGTLSLAVNPRISRAVLNAGGATLVDVFANPDSHFHQTLVDLIAPIQENSSEYLKLLQVAKWILDPADPANFARHVTTDILSSPLGAAFPAPASRELLTQTALCDGTVPNAQNTLLTALLGIPVPAPGAAGAGRAQWYVNTADTGASLACPGSAGTTSHGFLLDGTVPTLTTAAQTHAANFLLAPADQATTVRP